MGSITFANNLKSAAGEGEFNAQPEHGFSVNDGYADTRTHGTMTRTLNLSRLELCRANVLEKVRDYCLTVGPGASKLYIATFELAIAQRH